ncbi:MAG: hypothetical protein V1746_00305 [bacterium]
MPDNADSSKRGWLKKTIATLGSLLAFMGEHNPLLAQFRPPPRPGATFVSPPPSTQPKMPGSSHGSAAPSNAESGESSAPTVTPQKEPARETSPPPSGSSSNGRMETPEETKERLELIKEQMRRGLEETRRWQERQEQHKKELTRQERIQVYVDECIDLILPNIFSQWKAGKDLPWPIKASSPATLPRAKVLPCLRFVLDDQLRAMEKDLFLTNPTSEQRTAFHDALAKVIEDCQSQSSRSSGWAPQAPKMAISLEDLETCTENYFDQGRGIYGKAVGVFLMKYKKALLKQIKRDLKHKGRKDERESWLPGENGYHPSPLTENLLATHLLAQETESSSWAGLKDPSQRGIVSDPAKLKGARTSHRH